MHKMAQLKLRNFQKNMPPEKKPRENKRASVMSDEELFRPERQQIDRVLAEQKDGARVCIFIIYFAY